MKLIIRSINYISSINLVVRSIIRYGIIKNKISNNLIFITWILSNYNDIKTYEHHYLLLL